MHPSRPHPTLGDFFAGLTEYAFETRLGVADPQLVQYIADLLARFVHFDVIHKIRSLGGRRLEEVADMLAEAEVRLGQSRRQAHQHIGDYTLFWTGVYPEALPKLQQGRRKDHFLDYCAQGKRAYFIASTLGAGDDRETAVFKRLSHEFELCAYGLGEVRREWERRDKDGGQPLAPDLHQLKRLEV